MPHSHRPAVSLVPVAAALVLAACAADERAALCDRWAAPHGSDRAPGTRRQPLRTPQAAFDALRPGQSACLREGVYAGRPYVLAAVRGGRPNRPVTLRAAPGETAVLRGIVWVRRAARHVALSGLVIRGIRGQSTIKVYGRDVTVADSDITNRRRSHSCMLLGSRSAGAAIGVRILRNRLHDCGSRADGNLDHAIYASVVRGGLIAGNAISRPAAYAVQLYPDARGVAVTGNLIDGRGSARGGVVVGGDDRSASRDNTVSANVIAGATAAAGAVNVAWDGRPGTGNVVHGNCVSGGRGPAVAAAPGLVVRGNVRFGPAPGLPAPDGRAAAGTANLPEACARALERWTPAVRDR